MIINFQNPNLGYQNQTSFQGGKLIDLNYVLQKRSDLLPERVLHNVKEIVSKNPEKMPTLKEVHIDSYKPLLDCKTFDDVKERFPEFGNILDLGDVSYRFKDKFLAAAEKLGGTAEFTLKLLKDIWANSKNLTTIAQELNIGDRKVVQRLADRLNIPTKNTRYITLLKSTDPAERAVIAGKTTAWNKAHPEEMYAKNKHAAQFNKKPEYREAQSKMMKEYCKNHPERQEKISKYYKTVWAKCPEVADAIKEEMAEYGKDIARIVNKEVKGLPLTEQQEISKKVFFSKFWQKHPEMLAKYRQAIAEASAEYKSLNKNS